MVNIHSGRQNAFREHNVQRRTDHRHEQLPPPVPVSLSTRCVTHVLAGWAKDRMKVQARAQRTLEGHNGNLPSALRASHTHTKTHRHRQTHIHTVASDGLVLTVGAADDSHSISDGPLPPTPLCCSVLISIYHGNCSHRWGQRPGTHLPSFVCLWQGK